MRAGHVVRGQQAPDVLHLSFDRKVAPMGSYQESRRRWVPTFANSFGLPSGDSCPGRTPFCDSCYAGYSEQSKGVRELVEHNLALLEAAGDSISAISQLLAEMIDRFRVDADLRGFHGPDRLFRIHWDGDFYSIAYAQAWARIIRSTPDVTYWAYTRSFVPGLVDVVPVLAGIPNLALYLSVDEHNVEHVPRDADVQLALCAVDYKSARALTANLTYLEGSVVVSRPSAIACPENAGRMPLMADGVGACVTCQLCPTGRRDILFATSHAEEVLVAAPLRRKPAHGPCGRCGRPVKPRAARLTPGYCCMGCQYLDTH